MLDNLRKLGSSLIGKIMMAFLLVGLAGFGISGVLTSIGSNTVARVGNQDITIKDFQRAYNQQLDAAAQQLGKMPTAEQALAMGIPSSVLSSLAANAALDALASRMGLGVSDDRLGQMLRQDPSFDGANGQFDRANFNRALQMAGYTETEYLNTLRMSAERQQFITAAFADIVLPKASLDLFNRYTGDKRTISYYLLTPQTIAAPAAPSEAEMAAYLKDHQQTYRTTPTRTAKFMVLTVDALAKNITITEDQIKAEYEKIKASLSVPETRDIRQVVLTDAQKAAFEKGLADKTSFNELLAANNLTATDLGTLAKNEITDKTLADASFALKQPGDFALIPGALGTRAIEVAKINPARVKSLDEARADIVKRLKETEAKNKFTDVLDGIEEMRAAFKPIDEIAKQYNLDVTEVTLTQTGEALSAIPAIPAASDAKVANTVFSTEMGKLAPSIALSSTINVWFDLEKITDARDETLAEVGDQIKKAMIDQRTQEALKKAADADLAAIKAGESLNAAAAARNTFATSSGAFDRNGIANSPIDTSVAAAAFDGPTGLNGVAHNGNGDYVVFTVTNVQSAQGEPPAQARDYVTNGWRNTIYAEFVTALRSDIGMNIAQNTLARLIGVPIGQ